MMNARWWFLAFPLLAALGCSDPVPLPAQGAITLSIRKSTSTCPDSGTTYQVGDPLKPDSGTLVDGDKGAKISCSVKGGGGSFAFSGSIAATTTSGEPLPITVTLGEGTVDATGVGTANVGVYTPKFVETYTSNTACTVKVLNSQVKPGSIWATFACPSITYPPDSSCEVGTSTIVLENCDGT